ncbi:MAG TPA: hypothetical protein VLB67_09870 [Acidimicrobiia bacterium]|nr:hypothetical protein [Acidimicrobiia bacterium]
MSRILLAAALLMVLPLTAAAQDITPIAQLLESPDAHDRQVVTIRGEIVGDYGERGDIVWVQVNDDPYVSSPLADGGRLAGTNTGISVRWTGAVPDEFGDPGGHGVRGPIVQVTGVFRDLDPSLGGLTFIDATSVDLVEPARRLSTDGIDTPALVVGAVLTLAGLAAFAHRRDLFPRQRRS